MLHPEITNEIILSLMTASVLWLLSLKQSNAPGSNETFTRCLDTQKQSIILKRE